MSLILSDNILVTENISPAPSQSLDVIKGVCIYKKPLSLKNLCVAYANEFLILVTHPNVSVLGFKCDIVLKYSKVWFFFGNGYVSPSHLPIILALLANNSNFWPLPLLFTILPSTEIDAPAVVIEASS